LAGLTGIRTKTRGIFFGWWIVAASIIVQLLSSTLFLSAFGVYITSLERTFGWSRTAIAGAYSFGRLESSLLSPIQGWIIEKIGPANVMRIGVLTMASGLLFFSQINSLWTFYAAFIWISVGAGFFGFLTINVVVARWFIRHRAKAISFALLGGGIAGVLVPIIAWSIETNGWRITVFSSGVFILLAGFPLSQFFRRAPEYHGLLPDGDKPTEEQAKAFASAKASGKAPARMVLEGLTLKQSMRTSAFWFIGMGQTMALLPVMAILVHLIPHLEEERNLSLTQASFFLALVYGFQTVFQILGGFAADKYSKRMLATVAMLVNSAALFILAFSSTLGPVYAFAVLHGMAMGIRMPLLNSWRADLFGRRQLATIFGISSIFSAAGSTIAPVLVAWLADINGGEYRLAFIIVGTLVGLGALFFVLTSKPRWPKGQQATQHNAATTA
jgi:OFA family oxalate/formate antiporter-like MFS transporter